MADNRSFTKNFRLEDQHVVYEDNHLLAVNKPAGILVQGDETGDLPLSELAKEYVKGKYGKPGNVFMGVVHRLDRPVSGLVLLAKTSKALTRMNELFRNDKIQKTYLAITSHKPPQISARLQHWLVKDEARNVTKASPNANKGGLQSELSYTLLGREQDYYLLQVNPITGRPHQIRVQLASQGCPLLGDIKYGASTPLPDKSIGLHAYRLQFEHPIQKTTLQIMAPLPNKPVWQMFQKMAADLQ